MPAPSPYHVAAPLRNAQNKTPNKEHETAIVK